MKYNRWKHSRRIENDFLRALNKLNRIFQRFAKNASGDKFQFSEAMDKFQHSSAFENYIESIVKKMVIASSTVEADTWKEASRKYQKSGLIYRLLIQNINKNLKLSINDQIRRNATIISTLPNDVARKVVYDVEKATFQGKRADEIAEIIRSKTAQHARASAKLIARTEVSKTQTALVRARSQNLNIDFYVWRTSEDASVRDSHRIMNDVIIPWSQPPAPEILANEKPPKNNVYYHAGEIYNCRCYPEPLLDIDDVDWPHKVYWQGSIQRMSREKFSKLR